MNTLNQPPTGTVDSHKEMDLKFEWYLVLSGLMFFTLALNLPFGFLRSGTKRYSLRWFLYIHLPIPLIYLLRTMLMLKAFTIPLLAVAAVIGQVWGGKLRGARCE